MPMTPHKDESQSDFMARCVPDLMGDGKRENDQAVAACLQIWRDDKGGKKPPAKDYADPGYQADAKKRFELDDADAIRRAWFCIHVLSPEQQIYTAEQMRRIKLRITSAWKAKVGPKDRRMMPRSLAALGTEVMRVIARDYAPDPDDGESHDDYLERCVDELTDGDDSMDEDEATQACQLNWDEWSDRSVGNVMHKTHATETGGMEFVLSDATPDRFGDIVEVDGWVTENFKRNPIALFNHDKSFVIGKWVDLKTTDTDLRGHLQLAPKGTSPRIDEIRKLIEADILRAVSVGFVPLEHVPINVKDPWGGTRFLKSELVESSLVAVPANPNALAVAKSLNVSPATLRMVFGEHASKEMMRRDLNNDARRGEIADKRRAAKNGKDEDVREKRTAKPGEHAETHRDTKAKPMLLSQRIQDAEKHVLALQDQLDKHLEFIDDTSPTEEQMVLTEDLTTKIETSSRHLANLKAIETKNAAGAADARELTRTGGPSKVPAELVLRSKKKIDPIDIFVRALVVRGKSKAEGTSIDDMRRKIYGDDEATRIVCDYVLKAASAPAMTTVTGWAAELVQQIYAQFMEVLYPMSVFPKLQSMGLSLSFGQAGRIIIPTRNLTPSISGSFVGEGSPIPVRQGAFASQTVTPKKLAVITTWTKEMDDHSIPAIEGLLRQAVLEDTAIALDNILLDNNVATAIRPPGLRSYQAGTSPSVATPGFTAFVADYRALYNALLGLTNGNVRSPAILLNPTQTLDLSTMQPPAAAAPLWPLASMISAGKVGKADLIESSTVPVNMAIMVDAADFVACGAEGPRMEISDQATLHLEDTAPADIVSGPSGTPVPATPVKSMWQTDSLALRLIMKMNWIMRRPVVAWMTGTAWGS